MRILVLNCGSSSAKFEFFEFAASGAPAQVIAHGNIERIGETTPAAHFVGASGEQGLSMTIGDHRDAALQALKWLEQDAGASGSQVNATAHRIVHGGPRLFGPALLDDAAEREIEEASEFAPLHNPPALMAMRAIKEHLPNAPLIVLADTAFHRDLPPRSRNYALPRDLVNRYSIRRYGFHGCGHGWMMERYQELTGSDSSSLNLITLHLGAGCSATAIRGGRSVDTSMGFTPLEGLMMATRSGDLDPAIVSYLCRREGLDPSKVEELLNHLSGILGVSGVSRDMRDVNKAAGLGNADAALAIDMFCYRVRKYIGQYLAVAGETEAIIFGGGVGEHGDDIRVRICGGLEHLGIVVDPERNRAANSREHCFSADDSQIKLFVIPLNEELYIARAAIRLLRAQPSGRA